MESSIERKEDFIKINAFDRITNNLYLGNIASVKNYEDFDLVINCAFPDNKVGEGNIRITQPSEKTTVVNIGIWDHPDVDISLYFGMVTSYIHETLKKSQRVLVHCRAGVSRSSTFIIAFLMKYVKPDYEEILDHVRKCRPIVNPNRGFVKQLLKLQNKLNENKVSKHNE